LRTVSKTETEKQASRCDAVRHGLTAETVIGALEDAEDSSDVSANAHSRPGNMI
jgi:hypothetical protein